MWEAISRMGTQRTARHAEPRGGKRVPGMGETATTKVPKDQSRVSLKMRLLQPTEVVGLEELSASSQTTRSVSKRLYESARRTGM
eukprot:6204918-Pleurochrysis_carterae.AAC.1